MAETLFLIVAAMVLAMGWAYLAWSARTGWLIGRQRGLSPRGIAWIERASDPIGFWVLMLIHVFLWCGMAFAFLGMPLAAAVGAVGWRKILIMVFPPGAGLLVWLFVIPWFRVVPEFGEAFQKMSHEPLEGRQVAMQIGLTGLLGYLVYEGRGPVVGGLVLLVLLVPLLVNALIRGVR